MALKHTLDLRWIHVLATRNNHVFDAVLDGEETLIVHNTHVTCAQPAIHERLGSSIGSIPVFTHDVFAAYQHLTGFTDG